MIINKAKINNIIIKSSSVILHQVLLIVYQNAFKVIKKLYISIRCKADFHCFYPRVSLAFFSEKTCTPYGSGHDIPATSRFDKSASTLQDWGDIWPTSRQHIGDIFANNLKKNLISHALNVVTSTTPPILQAPKQNPVKLTDNSIWLTKLPPYIYYSMPPIEGSRRDWQATYQVR